MEYWKKIIREYRICKYYKKRAEMWKNFKKTHKYMECGLGKYDRWVLSSCCHNCCYDEDFFEKYGCMYIKDFMDY